MYQFTCNGLFDPNFSGTGHQPAYFDQLTPIYDHYTVFRSTCTYTLSAPNTALLVSHYLEDDTAVSTGTTSAEQSTAKAVMHLPSATRPLVLTRVWNAKSVFGGDLYDNDLLQGTSSTNPTEQQYFTLSCQSVDGVTNITYNFMVEIVYETVWDELKTISQS